MWGDAAWTTRQEERKQREAARDEQQWNQGTELENLLKKAETDLETARLIELARLLDPESFKAREEGLQNVQRMRLSPKGNDPTYQNAIRVHERTARLSIKYAINKAEAVLGLVRSWD